MSDPFTRKVADRVRFLAEGGTQVFGLLTPSLTAQSQNQSPRLDYTSLTFPARQIGQVDFKVPSSFSDEFGSRQVPPFGTRASPEHVNVWAIAFRLEVAIRLKPDSWRLCPLHNLTPQRTTADANRGEVGLPRRFFGLPKAQQSLVGIDQRIPQTLGDFPVTAKHMVARVIH